MSPNKKTKIENESEEEMQKLMEVGAQIDSIRRDFEEEVQVLKEKYSKLEKPLYTRRDKLANRISRFWGDCIENHPFLSSCLLPELPDREVLDYLGGIEVDLYRDGYKIVFNFDDNPFFTNTKLSKSLNTDGTTVTDKIGWRKTKKDSFFEWFENQDVEIGHIICDDLYPNAQNFFNPEFDEESDEESIVEDEVDTFDADSIEEESE